MNNFLIAGKAKDVFKIIRLLAKAEREGRFRMIRYSGMKSPDGVGPQHVYKRENDGEMEELTPAASQKVWNHSPDGFQWGYGGSGPAQLALAILLDVTRDKDKAVRHHQDFKRDFVAAWTAGWELTSQEVLDWLQKKEAEIREASV